MARRAEHVYVLAHGSKLVRQPFHAWAPRSKKWTLVTDHDADSDGVAAFTASGIEVVVVDHEGHPVR